MESTSSLAECHGLPLEARLRLHSQYAAVRAEGTSVYGPFFRLSCLRKEEGVTQLGIIVSKRVGNAVIRNQVKRRFREIYRIHRAHLQQHLWLVLIAAPRAATASFQELQAEWLRLGKKIPIFTSPC